MSRRRSQLLFSLAISLASGLLTTAATAQALSERAEVRAGALLVAIEGRSGAFRRSGPVRFSSQDFEVRLGGKGVTVLSVDESYESAEGQPWQILIYVDAALASNDLVRSAAGLLAGAAADLAALGSVEVIVADPDPGLLLASTRDEVRINETLAGLAIGARGDDLLVEQRRDLVDLVDRSVDLVELALEHEVQIVRRQSDRLLTWLTNSPQGSARRALLLVSGGFDLEPRAFSEALSGALPSNAASAPDGGAIDQEEKSRLTALQEELGRAIAAGGWISFSLRLPEPDPLPRRWGLQRSLLVRADGNWDPERAEALFELGESLIAQRKWKAAEQALRDAVYHYYSQPKLRPRQAQALLRLAFVLEQQGRRSEADKVSRKAIHLDPSVSSEVTLVGLLDPMAPLALLAESTSGGLVADRQSLDDALVGLSHRLLLEYQTEGLAPDEPISVTVDFDVAAHEALAVGWAPGASPTLIARARSRRLLEQDMDVAITAAQLLEPASLGVACSFQGFDEGVEGRTAVLDVAVDPGLGTAWEGLETRLRVTASAWVDDAIATVQATGDTQEWLPGDELTVAVELAATTGDPEVAVVIEEMATKRWLATFSECELPPD